MLGKIGVIKNISDVNNFTPRVYSGYVLKFTPLADEYKLIVSKLSPEFLILKSISGYAHFMTAIWSCLVSVMSTDHDISVKNDQLIFVDFESAEIFVSENKDDDKILHDKLESFPIANFDRYPVVNGDLNIRILGEANSATEIDQSLAQGAVGIGIIKGEFFQDDLNKYPESKEFRARLKQVSSDFPILVRFFDFEIKDADPQKKLKGALGYRGIRLLEIDSKLFEQFMNLITQLDIDNLIIILPMIVLKNEIVDFKARLKGKNIRLGITVETPSAAICIKEIVEIVDFIEIGLNDLTQYTMAWDRDTPNFDRLPTDTIAPAVGKLIAMVVEACQFNKIPYTLGLDLKPSAKLARQIKSLQVRSISCHANLVKIWRYFLNGN